MNVENGACFLPAEPWRWEAGRAGQGERGSTRVSPSAGIWRGTDKRGLLHGSCISVDTASQHHWYPTHLMGLRGPLSRWLGGIGHRARNWDVWGEVSHSPHAYC